MSTLNGQRVLELRTLEFPPAGVWWANLTLESGAPPAVGSRATLTVADLSLPGTILRAGSDVPQRPDIVVVGGAGGWGAQIASVGSFAASAGVRLSTVLRALALATGETFDAPPDVTIGACYSWSRAVPPLDRRTYDSIANDLARRGAAPSWHVVPSTGHTAWTSWPALPEAAGRVRVTDRDLSRGVRMCGLDVAAACLLPGATLEGATVARLTLTESSSAGLRASVWGS